MRYDYSVVRFVPNPARGEFVNIGVLAGSDDSGEWILQSVSRADRARRIDEEGVWPEVAKHVAYIAAMLDAATEARNMLHGLPDIPTVSEQWLAQLTRDSANILQFTPPRPIVTESAQAAIDALWPQFIAEPEAHRRQIITKHRALASVKEALRQHHVGRNNWHEQVRLEAAGSHSQIDFAVHNGRVVQITQCWSFQIADQESLLEDVKAWAWTIRGLRSNGGRVLANGSVLTAAPDTPVAAVYVPPQQHTSYLTEAQTVFRDDAVRAEQIPFSESDQIGVIASQRLQEP